MNNFFFLHQHFLDSKNIYEQKIRTRTVHEQRIYSFSYEEHSVPPQYCVWNYDIFIEIQAEGMK